MKYFLCFSIVVLILANYSCKSKASNATPDKKEMHLKKSAGSLWDCEEYIDTSNNQNNPFITVEKDSVKKLRKVQ